MRQIVDKISIFPTIIYGYTMPLRRIFLTLRLVFTYLFFSSVIGVSLSESFGTTSSFYEWGMWLTSTILFGWALFHITRAIYFDETLRTMKMEEIVELWRFGACLKTIIFFLIFSLGLFLTQGLVIDLFKTASIKENFWGSLALVYAAAMLSLARYIAVAPAVRARSYTFFYMIFYPSYLFKLMVFALFTYLPFYALLYGGKVLQQLRLGGVDYTTLFEQNHILDYMIHGSVDILCFIFFSSMVVIGTKEFIVPESSFKMRKLKQAEVMKPYLDENGREVGVSDYDETPRSSEPEIIMPEQKK